MIRPIPGHFRPTVCEESAYPEIQARVESIVAKIFAGTPDVFNQEAYDPATFCVIVEEADDTMTASADSVTRIPSSFSGMARLGLQI